MKIIRNGHEIELTNEEIRLASYEYDNECLKEDILSKGNDMEIDIPEEVLDDIITIFNKVLSNNESYWDAYWFTIENVIKEFTQTSKIWR